MRAASSVHRMHARNTRFCLCVADDRAAQTCETTAIYVLLLQHARGLHRSVCSGPSCPRRWRVAGQRQHMEPPAYVQSSWLLPIYTTKSWRAVKGCGGGSAVRPSGSWPLMVSQSESMAPRCSICFYTKSVSRQPHPPARGRACSSLTHAAAYQHGLMA